MTEAKTILISGASTGFGRGLAEALSARGWKVFAGVRNFKKIEDLERVTPILLDVTDSEVVKAAVGQVLDQTNGRLDALVNNAGYSVLGAFEDLDDARCREQMETNFFGALAVTRAVLPAMRRAQKGRIVLVSSNAVNTPHPMLSMYAASKWALEGWAEGLAMEVAPFGIDLVVVEPGAHRTPFAQNVQFFLPDDSAYKPWFDAAGPSISDLDHWGRDPALAIAPLIEVVEAPSPAFRRTLGEDTQLFSRLKGAFPYEVRAMILRAIIGAPGRGALKAEGGVEETSWPVADQVLARITKGLESDPQAMSVLAAAFGLQDKD
jgi:NAD(P)-dependent dehydrogenase (short-subunit alcohol dehydrogenase family)